MPSVTSSLPMPIITPQVEVIFETGNSDVFKMDNETFVLPVLFQSSFQNVH